MQISGTYINIGMLCTFIKVKLLQIYAEVRGSLPNKMLVFAQWSDYAQFQAKNPFLAK